MADSEKQSYLKPPLREREAKKGTSSNKEWGVNEYTKLYG